ncbi:MAG: YceI family protein [Pseudomonadota bacterium]
MKRLLAAAVAAALSFSTAPAFADGWSLAPEHSKVAFGSIKSGTVGEAHHFTGLTGTVGEDGAAAVQIDVTKLETWVDIRNERMLKHVFDAINFPKVEITGKIDMAAASALKPGESTILSEEITVKFLETELPLDAELFVLAVSDDMVLVTTDEMLMVETADLGIDGGVDELMELASLESITRVTPVTLRLMFEKN